MLKCFFNAKEYVRGFGLAENLRKAQRTKKGISKTFSNENLDRVCLCVCTIFISYNTNGCQIFVCTRVKFNCITIFSKISAVAHGKFHGNVRQNRFGTILGRKMSQNMVNDPLTWLYIKTETQIEPQRRTSLDDWMLP